jgi:hypothetical protein
MCTRFETHCAVTVVTELPRYKNYVTGLCFTNNIMCDIVAPEECPKYKQFLAS